MAKRKDEKIKVVVMNPERLPVAREKLMKFLYEEYMKKASKEEIGGNSKQINQEENRAYSHKGTLKHNSQGRYSFEDGYYFTSGDPVEIFYDGEWLKGRIEYSHESGDYYFCMEDEAVYVHNLEGIEARA